MVYTHIHFDWSEYTFKLTLHWFWITRTFLICCFGFFSSIRRWKAVQMLMGGLWMALCPQRRIDPPLPQAHRCQAIQMPTLRSVLLAIGSFGSAYETSCLRPITISSRSSSSSSQSTGLYSIDECFHSISNIGDPRIDYAINHMHSLNVVDNQISRCVFCFPSYKKTLFDIKRKWQTNNIQTKKNK